MRSPLDNERVKELWNRVLPYVPWLSLASGVASALLLERKPEKAWMVAAAAAGVWITTGLILYLTGRRAESGGKWEGVLGFSSLVALQSLTQLALFFSGPFYLRAATWDLGHGIFLACFIAAVVAASWDPIFYSVQKSRVLSSVLLSFSTFAGLNCVLPMLGLSNWWSLLAAALCGTLGIPLIGRLRDPIITEAHYRLGVDIAIGLVLPVLLWFGAASLVPPAPLRLSQAAIGTTIADRWVSDPTTEFTGVPARIACATAISAPRGLDDRLFHIWELNGEETDRIELKVRGGREEGFRTWSVKQHVAVGDWSCRVETENGQLLGKTSAEVNAATPE